MSGLCGGDEREMVSVHIVWQYTILDDNQLSKPFVKVCPKVHQSCSQTISIGVQSNE